jgi:hypothetical protein
MDWPDTFLTFSDAGKNIICKTIAKLKYRVGIHKAKSNGCSIGFTKLECTKTIDSGPLTKKSNS